MAKLPFQPFLCLCRHNSFSFVLGFPFCCFFLFCFWVFCWGYLVGGLGFSVCLGAFLVVWWFSWLFFFFNINCQFFCQTAAFTFSATNTAKADTWPHAFILSERGVGRSTGKTGNLYPWVSHVLRAETFLYFLASEQVGITISIALCEQEYVFSFHYHSFLFCWWSELARRMFFYPGLGHVSHSAFLGVVWDLRCVLCQSPTLGLVGLNAN